jgi:hypothetical protein
VNVISIPYPPEYKDLAPNTALLKRIASETSGTFRPSADTLMSRHFRPSRTFTDIWWLLALLSMLLLPIDVAVRRLSLSPEQAVELLQAVVERLERLLPHRRKHVKAERTETMSALLRAKKSTVISDQPIEPPVIVEPVAEKKPAQAAPSPTPQAPAAPEKPAAVPKAAPQAAEKKPAEEPADSGADTTSRLLRSKRMRNKDGDS